ncbi:MAG: hypothetical protein FJ098_16550 [Deltaproteobacteria bacterium]|nr:hypothetical protein [Deltaproteobacteria bacterium]
MRRLATGVAVGAATLAAAVLAAAWAVDRFAATEVQIIAARDPAVVAVEKALWMEGDPVTELYGVPAGQPVRVAFVDPGRLIRPDEDPSLVLLPVDKQAGENPLQVKTVWFVALRAAAGLGFLALGAGAAAWLLRRGGAAQSRASRT